MKKSLEIISKHAFYSGLSGLMLTGLIVLSGCEPSAGGPPSAPSSFGPPGGPPGSRIPGAPMPGSLTQHTEASFPKKQAVSPIAAARPAVPGAPTQDPGNKQAESKPGSPASAANGAINPMAPMSKVEQAGNTVELASAVIAAGANPFLNRLPVPMVATTTPISGGNTSAPSTVAPPPPADPFASLNILGIAYHPTAPMALLSVGGGSTDQTQLVHKGDVLNVEAGSIKITGITPGGVDLQMVGVKSETKTLSLPSIIGYTGAKSESGNPSSGEAGSSQALPPEPGAEHTPSGGLSNLSKLGSGSGAPSSAASSSTGSTAKSPNVSLQEL